MTTTKESVYRIHDEVDMKVTISTRVDSARSEVTIEGVVFGPRGRWDGEELKEAHDAEADSVSGLQFSDQ